MRSAVVSSRIVSSVAASLPRGSYAAAKEAKLDVVYVIAGHSERRVRAIFVIEAGLIGFAGALIGFALGYALCAALGTVTIRNPLTDVTRLPIAYSPVHYAMAAGVAIISSLAAGYLPARKAARLHPVDIIRGAT